MGRIQWVQIPAQGFLWGILEAYFWLARKAMPHSLESLDKLTYWISD
jgi:hypothetical protein